MVTNIIIIQLGLSFFYVNVVSTLPKSVTSRIVFADVGSTILHSGCCMLKGVKSLVLG